MNDTQLRALLDRSLDKVTEFFPLSTEAARYKLAKKAVQFIQGETLGSLTDCPNVGKAIFLVAAAVAEPEEEA